MIRKNIKFAGLLLCAGLTFAACTNKTPDEPEATKKAETQAGKDSTSDPREVEDISALDVDIEGIDLSKYCNKLGKYKGVEIEVLRTSVTDEDIEKEIKNALETYPLYEDVTDRDVAQDKDFTIIDYKGTMNGEAFSGGTAEDARLELGSGSFINGFETGVIGMKVGETKVLKLKFPDDYGNTELAGKDVEFEVTLKKIQKLADEQVATDAWVESNFKDISQEEGKELKTVADLKEEITNFLSEQKTENSQQQKIRSVMDAILEGSELAENLPRQCINSYYKEEYQYVESMATAYGLTMEQYLSYYNMTLEDYKNQCYDYALMAVKEDVVLKAVADAEKMEITDDYYKSEISKLYEEYKSSFENEEAFVESNGGEKEVKRKLLLMMARDFVVDNAKVTKEVDEITKEPTDPEKVAQHMQGKDGEETEGGYTEESAKPEGTGETAATAKPEASSEPEAAKAAQ